MNNWLHSKTVVLACLFLLCSSWAKAQSAKPEITAFSLEPGILYSASSNNIEISFSFEDADGNLDGGMLILTQRQNRADTLKYRFILAGKQYAVTKGTAHISCSIMVQNDNPVRLIGKIRDAAGKYSTTEKIKIIPETGTSELFTESLPAPVQRAILWSADHETGDLSQWEDYGTDDYYSGGGIFITDKKNTDYGLSSSYFHSGESSVYTTIKKAIKARRGNKAVRLMRWTDKPWDQEGDYFPAAAYYSVWMFLPDTYNPNKYEPWDPGDGGWWNVFQFKSDNGAGSQPVVALDLYFDENLQQMVLGLVVKDYPDWNSSDHQQTYITQSKPRPVLPNRWTHIEVFLRKSTTNGRVVVWQDGKRILAAKSITTVLGETATWGIGNYTDHVSGGPRPGEATIYFDDAIVSRRRISDHIN